jgi:hypothetical protein
MQPSPQQPAELGAARQMKLVDQEENRAAVINLRRERLASGFCPSSLEKPGGQAPIDSKAEPIAEPCLIA